MSDYEEIRKRLLDLFSGERVTFADRVHILNYLDNLNKDNERMRYLVQALRICSSKDADARDCPFYDKGSVFHCKLDLY